MAKGGAWFNNVYEPFGHLRDHTDRLFDLRRKGLGLVSTCDIEAVTRWREQWAEVLDVIRTKLYQMTPRKAELLLWPDVNGSQSLRQTREELVRAAVGCRELSLLVDQLVGSQDKVFKPTQVPLQTAESLTTRNFVGPGQRFEGAVMLRRLIEAANRSLVIIDHYMDAGTFTLAAAATDRIQRRFLSSDHPAVKPKVTKDWANWRGVWVGNSECRLAKELPHFRLLYVDGAAYHVDASFKDFGSSLTFVQMLLTEELENIKAEIESTWRQATPL